MKKLLLFIVIFLIALGVWYTVHNHPSVVVPASATTPTAATSAGNPDPTNATFTFDDGPVTLKKGTALSPVDPDTATQTETDLTQTIAYGDLNNDGKQDAAVLLLQQGGGTGVFLYVAAYVSGNVSYQGTNAVFVGDRISPTSLSIKNGIITLDYLDRKPDDPMDADPTVPTTKTYSYSNGELVEK